MQILPNRRLQTHPIRPNDPQNNGNSVEETKMETPQTTTRRVEDKKRYATKSTYERKGTV